MTRRIDYLDKVGFVFDEEAHTQWLNKCLSVYQVHNWGLDFIFLSDDDLWLLNKQHLNHDYYTDVITYDYSLGEYISGDICISIDRVKENAGSLWEEELRRVMIHGLLHLLGYADKNSKDRLLMRKEEDYCLKMFHVER